MSIFEKIINDLNDLDNNTEVMLYFTQKISWDTLPTCPM